MESTSLFEDFVRPLHPPAPYIGGKRKLARRIFSAFAMVDVEVTYSVGGGDKTQHTRELVISNLPQDELMRIMG